jgi:hypothetical protein
MKQISVTTYALKFLLVIAAAAALHLSVDYTTAAAKSPQAENQLLDTYHKNEAKLKSNGFGLPLILESSENDDRVHVDVYGIFDFPFSNVADVLKVPANWCDIVALHPNVKACTHGEQSGNGQLTFYIGKKEYQSPQEARPVVYRYRNVAQQNGYLDIILSADEGPFGTKDHAMRFEALPLKGGKTFVHVSYEYSDSMALRLAGKAYFATLGRSKVGFTVTGTDGNDKPIYIGGPRGAVERNAVRYYFAIQSFMIAQHSPEKNLLGIRTGQWFDLTTRYKQQLSDMGKNDYLAFKIAEHKNQVTLQLQIGTALK